MRCQLRLCSALKTLTVQGGCACDSIFRITVQSYYKERHRPCLEIRHGLQKCDLTLTPVLSHLPPLPAQILLQLTIQLFPGTSFPVSQPEPTRCFLEVSFPPPTRWSLRIFCQFFFVFSFFPELPLKLISILLRPSSDFLCGKFTKAF